MFVEGVPMGQLTKLLPTVSSSPIAAVACLALCAGVSSVGWTKDLYVSPSGNDSTSYASNSVSAPWLTVDHGLYNLKAGDKLIIRGGTYAPRYPVWLSSDYNRQQKGGDPNERNNAESGTQSAPIIVESYPNETVTINLAAMTTNQAGAWIYLDNKSWWTFRNLTFINSIMVFVVGEDAPTQHNTFENLKITANRGGDNAGGIHLWGKNAEYTQILNCVIKGPGQNVHLNTAAIYVKGVNNLKIIGNALSDAPIGIYYKHRNAANSAAEVNIEIANNYIWNTTRASLEYNANFSKVHDNVFGTNTAAAHFGDANGSAGADYNQITHNTFLSGSLNFDSAIEGGDPWPGVTNNNVVNNIFMRQLEVLRYVNLTNTNTFGKNLYPNANPITSLLGLIRISADSLVGIPTYNGGSNPSSLAGFTLASGSMGKGAATDGSDLGSNIAGMLAGGLIFPSPPTQVAVQ
jgi:hypothetical protein